jgi:hypothetical protein
LESESFNDRGTGGEQYPTGMMLALLIYCSANIPLPGQAIS